MAYSICSSRPLGENMDGCESYALGFCTSSPTPPMSGGGSGGGADGGCESASRWCPLDWLSFFPVHTHSSSMATARRRRCILLKRAIPVIPATVNTVRWMMLRGQQRFERNQSPKSRQGGLSRCLPPGADCIICDWFWSCYRMDIGPESSYNDEDAVPVVQSPEKLEGKRGGPILRLSEELPGSPQPAPVVTDREAATSPQHEDAQGEMGGAPSSGQEQAEAVTTEVTVAADGDDGSGKRGESGEVEAGAAGISTTADEGPSEVMDVVVVEGEEDENEEAGDDQAKMEQEDGQEEDEEEEGVGKDDRGARKKHKRRREEEEEGEGESRPATPAAEHEGDDDGGDDAEVSIGSRRSRTASRDSSGGRARRSRRSSSTGTGAAATRRGDKENAVPPRASGEANTGRARPKRSRKVGSQVVRRG